MKLSEFRPHTSLQSFIACYWELTGDKACIYDDGVIPDGCVDIIINLGENYPVKAEQCLLQHGKAYIGGATTAFKAAQVTPGTHLVGVRFRPGGFSHAYDFSSLHEVTDCCIELLTKQAPDISAVRNNFAAAFDVFYTNTCRQPGISLVPIVASIRQCNGLITVGELAAKHFTTVKQLERHFKFHLGLSPKQFTNIIRNQFARKLIREFYPARTFTDIAAQSGYYDQAHFNSAMKKYAGTAPSSYNISGQ